MNNLLEEVEEEDLEVEEDLVLEVEEEDLEEEEDLDLELEVDLDLEEDLLEVIDHYCIFYSIYKNIYRYDKKEQEEIINKLSKQTEEVEIVKKEEIDQDKAR